MTQSIKELAIQMNVREADVLMFAQSIANGIERDRADRSYVSGSEKLQVELVEAYAADSVRKFNNFQAVLMTNKEAKDVFVLDVYNKLREVK